MSNPLILRQSPSGDPFRADAGDVLVCLGGDVWEGEDVGIVTGFAPRGTGAEFKTLYATDQNLVWVTDFMTDAEQQDCFDGTRLLDLQPAIQQAIDYAIYRDTASGASGGPRVRLPAGVLRIDRPIQLGYGTNIRSVILEGEGMRFGGTFGAQGSGTGLVVTFNDAPAIVVQGLYFSQIRDLSIFGPNSNWIINNPLNAPSMADLNVSNWIDPSFPASSSARFSMQCGIGIDPYSGVQPATHYPAVPYPTFLGAVAQYGKTFSSNLVCTNVYIEGFVAGIALQPCDADGNGDFVRFDNVTVKFCAYGFVWGNSQARVTTFTNCDMAGIHTGFSNLVVGKQQGDSQIFVRGMGFGQMIRIANMTMSFGGGARFSHCFSEAMYSIGIVGVNATSNLPIVWEDCVFGFSWWSRYGIPTYVYVNGSNTCMSVFNQCQFFLSGLALVQPWGGLNFQQNGASLLANQFIFTNCTTGATPDPTQLWEKCAFNATAGLGFRFMTTTIGGYGWRVDNAWNLDTGAALGVALYGPNNTGARNRCLPAYGIAAHANTNGAAGGDVPLGWRIGGVQAAGATTQVGRNISFTVTGYTPDKATHTGGESGDRMWSQTTGAAFLVYDRTGTTISARAMSGFDSSGNLLVAIPDNEIFWGLNTRRYCPGTDKDVYGDLTAGSPNITNVVDGTGAVFDASSVITVGDWLCQDHEVNKLFNTANGTDSQVNAIIAGQITMNANAIRTITHMRLGLFTRPGMPNGTPTP